MDNVFNIPAGIKNLSEVFPAVNWDNVRSYTVSVTDGASTIATTPLIRVACCPSDSIRIHFLNSLGGFDAVDFYKPKVVHEDTASQFQKPLPFPLLKTDTGTERFNIKSNDTYEAKLNCHEEDMDFIRELADSPKMFLEWEGTEGQADSYIPLVKVAGKFDKLKNDLEFSYSYIIQFKLSNEYVNLRN